MSAAPGTVGRLEPARGPPDSHPEVTVGALGRGVVGRVVAEVAEVGALGGGLGWARAGPPGPAPSRSLGLEF